MHHQESTRRNEDPSLALFEVAPFCYQGARLTGLLEFFGERGSEESAEFPDPIGCLCVLVEVLDLIFFEALADGECQTVGASTEPLGARSSGWLTPV